MEKKNIYSIRKSKVGAVSTKIAAVVFLALAGGVALNSTEAHAAEEATVSVKEEKTVEKAEIATKEVKDKKQEAASVEVKVSPEDKKQETTPTVAKVEAKEASAEVGKAPKVEEKTEAKKPSEEKSLETAGKKAEAPVENNKKQEVSEENIQGTGLDREENYDDDVATVAESSAAADTKIDLDIMPLNKWNSSLSQTEKSKKIWSIASRVEDGTLVFRVKTVEPYSYSYLPTVFEANTGREKVSFDNNKIDDNNFEVRFTGLADGHWKLYDFSLVDLNNKAITFTQRDLIGFNTGELIGKGTYAVASDITLPSGSYYNVVTDKKTIKVGETVKYTFKIKDATDPKITRISLRQDGKKGLAITTFYRSYLDDNGNAVAYETMYENDRGVMTLEDFAYKTNNNSREINVYSNDLKKINERIAVEYSEGVLRGWIPKGSNWYYIKNDGTKATNTWVGDYYVKADGTRSNSEWIKVGNSWYYTNYDGRYVRNEWVDDYYLNNNGTRATSQWKDRGSNRYFLKGDGSIARNTWVQGEYYVKADGAMSKNEWIKVGNSWYYTNYDGRYARNEWVGDYYLNNNGTRATSQWKDRGSNRYFLKGDGSIARNTWVQGEYYVKSDGAMAKSEWVKVGNAWYYADYDGRYARNTWKDGYYLNSNGIRIDNSSTKQGWVQEGYNWYYIKNDGTKATNTWVGDYYVKGDGTRASNEWIKVGNSWYYTYYDGTYARNTWIGDYYLKDNGIRATSQWKDRGSNRYFLKGDGSIARNTWVQGEYYVKADGTMSKNEWVKVGNSWYYTNYDGRYARNEWVDDYYLNNNGTRATSQWKDRGSNRYFLKGDGSIARNTWVQGEYYVKSDGAMAKSEWVKVGNAWYYADYDGKYARNTWRDGYYLNSNGIRITPQTTRRVEVRREVINYQIETRYNSNLYEGTTNVIQEGRNGSYTVVRDDVYEGNTLVRYGQEQQINRVEAVNRIVEVGTRKPQTMRKVEVRRETIAYTTETRNNYSLLKGTTNVIQEGRNGSYTVVRYDVYVGDTLVRYGQEQQINRVEPVNRIVEVGMKEPQTTRRVEVRKETISHGSETRYNYSLLKGTTNVIQEGRDGSYTVVRDDIYEGNTLISYGREQQINRVEPVTEIIEVGMKEPQTTRRVEVRREVINYRTETNYNPNLYEGTTNVIQEGRDGSYTVVRDDIYEGNTLISYGREQQINRVEAVNRIVEVGTKAVPKDRIIDVNKGDKIGDAVVTGEIYGKLKDFQNKSYSDLMKESESERFKKASEDDYGYILTKRPTNSYGEYSYLGAGDEMVKLYNSTNFVDTEKVNKYFVEYINIDRKAKGLNPLQYSPQLEKLTTIRSQEMADYGYLRYEGKPHTRPDNTSWATVLDLLPENERYKGFGENILAYSVLSNPYELVSERWIAKKMFEQWKSSPGHYANMMTPEFTKTAVSFKLTTRTGAKNNTAETNWMIGTQILSS